MISLNTNFSSLIAQSSLKNSTNILNQAVERMTTGYKINHAKDNAANYSIATNMTTQLNAYDVAADNVAMGMDLVTTAMDIVSMMQDRASRLQALSTQARNGTYGAQSLDAINAEANALISEITRLYTTAEYNGVSLFNRKAYEIADHLPQADPTTGFINNHEDYSDLEIANMKKVSENDEFLSGETYSIATADELKKLADYVNNGNNVQNVTFVLAADIDLSEYGNWVPIGNYSVDTANVFRGIFNGNGHYISNLKINNSNQDYQGLFGKCGVGFIIKNLGVENASVVGKENVGLLAGDAEYSSEINNVFAEGDVIGNKYVGGLVGKSFVNIIQNSYSEANIKGSQNVGGLLGYHYYALENCFSNSVVKGNNYVGGLVGYLPTTDIKNTLINCYTEGHISGDSHIGGFIGSLYAQQGFGKEFINCVTYAEASGNSYCGDFIGQISFDANSSLTPITISDCSSVSYNSKYIANSSQDTTNLENSIQEVAIFNISMDLQVGINSGTESQIKFDTNFIMKLDSIMRDDIKSEKAFKNINNLINVLSEKATSLGTVQNRLESALDEISSQYENLASSRSTIRDADIAEESASYIQQQILQEAAATLLATANQSPSIALQLI